MTELRGRRGLAALLLAGLVGLFVTAGTGFTSTPAAAQYGPQEDIHYVELVSHVEFVCNEGERITGVVRNHVIYKPVVTGNGWRYTFHYESTFVGVSESGLSYRGQTITQQMLFRDREDYPAPARMINVVTAHQIGAGEGTADDDLKVHSTLFQEITESGEVILRIEGAHGECN